MVELRAAVPADARELAEVHVEGWTWGYRGQLPDDVIAARTVAQRTAQWEEMLASADPRTARLVATYADGAILGFVATGPADAEHVPPSDGAGEVFAIYLRERAAGTGVGRTLFAAGQDAMRAAGFTRGVLWVLASNDRARRFYEAAGWSWDGTVGEHRYDCDEQQILRFAADL